MLERSTLHLLRIRSTRSPGEHSHMLSKSSAYPASHTCLYPQDEVVKGQIQPIIPEPKICTKDEAVKCKCSYRHSMVVVQGTLVTMYTEHGLAIYKGIILSPQLETLQPCCRTEDLKRFAILLKCHMTPVVVSSFLFDLWLYRPPTSPKLRIQRLDINTYELLTRPQCYYSTASVGRNT